METKVEKELAEKVVGKVGTRGHIDEYLTETARKELIIEDFKKAGIDISSEEAGEIRNSLEWFSGSGYKWTRYAQHGMVTRPGGSVLKLVDLEDGMKAANNIEKYLGVAPRFPQQPVYRGMTEVADKFEKMKVGDIWEPKALSSWSSDEMVAKDFLVSRKEGGPGSVLIELMEGSDQSTSLTYFAGKRNEVEVILSGKNRLELVKKEWIQDERYVEGKILKLTMKYEGTGSVLTKVVK